MHAAGDSSVERKEEGGEESVIVSRGDGRVLRFTEVLCIASDGSCE